jgi:acetyl-CoA synthetase
VPDHFDFGGEIVWRPSSDVIEHAHLTAFMHRQNIRNYDQLMDRSTHEIAWFTGELLKYLDIQFYEPYLNVLDLSNGLQFPRWCVDGKMNIVHNCVDKWQHSVIAGQPSLIWEGEEGKSRTLTYKELHQEVNRCANVLRSLGLGKGDAIGLFMPLTPETVVAMLAVIKIGGVMLPLFSGYGAGAVATRLMDAEAKALFTADGTFRRGKTVDMKSVADEAVAQVPGLEHVIVLKRTGHEVPMDEKRDHWWHELISRQKDVAETEITSAEDPLMVIYTSGTTGKPKGAVHTHCGFPVKAAQDMAFGTDVHAGDVMFWMTDMGWMMGPWLVFGTLLLGATMFLYDGAPDYPGPDRIWSMVERYKITQLGLSPTFVRGMIPYGAEMALKNDISSLRCFASTGEPWNPDPWMWLFQQVGGGTRPIINYSGGTEISGGIVMGNPILPLKPCAFSAPCPGMAAEVLDEDGRSVINEVGELAIKAPWIGMTRGFWKNPQRYLETYWSRWPDVWVHGDFAAVDDDGLWYILGRSDDTLKIAGKRLGPAEVESILVHHADVVESAAIGVPDDIKGMALVVFCVLKKEVEPDETLRNELKQMVVDGMGKPLAPKDVLFVSDLPKTRNAKVMRRMIRSAYLGQELGDTSSLVNPEAVDEIRNAR